MAPETGLDGAARLCFHAKETEQYHICFGAPGLRRDDERRYPLAVLDSIFGGSTSSRLFREVREKRGLAYSVGSYNEQFTDQGLVATYVGTREDNVEEACAIIGAELARLRSEPVSAEELARAKESVKGRLVLSSESTAARMTRISRATLFGLPIESLDEMLAKVDAVEVDDLTELAAELYGAERLSAACVGAEEESLPRGPGAGQRDPGGGVIRVAVAGAAGRMGQAVCEAVEEAEDTVLSGRADPALGTELAEVLGEADVVVDFTVPGHGAGQRPRLPRGRRPRRRRHHRLRPRRRSRGCRLGERQLLRRAQLRDRRGAADGGLADDRPPHARVRDRRAPPRPQARRPVGHRQAHRRS